MAIDSSKDLRSHFWVIELERENDFMEFVFERIRSVRISYYESGQADDFELVLENKEKYFSNVESFMEGDTMFITISSPDRSVMEMGRFQVDDINDEYSRDQGGLVRVSGLSVETVEKDMRTIKTRGYENTDLFKIVEEISQEHDLEPKIAGDNIRFTRREQKEEHDLRFLTRLAEENGFNFRIQNESLYFIKQEIDESQPAISLEGIVRKRTFRRKNFNIYRRANSRYYDPTDREYKHYELEDENIDNVEEMKLTHRSENMEQAERHARSELKRKNKQKIQGEFEVMGWPELRAGLNVWVTGEGTLYDGIWHIEEAQHIYQKSGGYVVNLRGYRLPEQKQPDMEISPDGTTVIADGGDPVPRDPEEIPSFVPTVPRPGVSVIEPL